MTQISLTNQLFILAVHCVWDDWIEGDCSATCGYGLKTNTRTKLVEESYGGNCTGEATEVSLCIDTACPSRFFSFVSHL